MINYFKFIPRWIKRVLKPEFWVCTYEIQGFGNRQSGQFACLEKDYIAACKEAIEHIQGSIMISGTCLEITYIVRKPRFWEVRF